MKGCYIPETLTPLSFTSIYQTIPEEARLAYNRLHGLYFLEQTIFFEQIMGKPALRWIIKTAEDPELAKEAMEFLDEEDKHSEWFRKLLRDVRPEIYQDRDFDLLHAPRPAVLALRAVAGSLRWLPCLLWLQLIAEERALYFGRCYVEAAADLDPRFLAVQKLHLADEPGHIRRDEMFIRWLWPRCGPRLRRANAWILRYMLKEWFHLPKRSGWRVVERWLRQFPKLEKRRGEFRTAMDGLQDNQTYLRTLYPRRHLKRTLALAAPWPELAFLDDFVTDPT